MNARAPAAREARGVVERGPHAEIATERVSGGLTASDAQRVLQLADEGRQRGGRIPAPCDRNGAAARAGQVRHDEAKAVAEALELIAPRVTRGHQAVDQQQRRGIARAVAGDVRSDVAERLGPDHDGGALRVGVAMR